MSLFTIPDSYLDYDPEPLERALIIAWKGRATKLSSEHFNDAVDQLGKLMKQFDDVVAAERFRISIENQMPTSR